MTFPVIEAEDMPDIAANSLSIAFGDFSRGYLVVDRAGVTVLRDPYSSKPYVLFYTTKRVGGGVQDFDAIKVALNRCSEALSGLIGDIDSSFPFVWYLQQVQTRITGNWNRMNRPLMHCSTDGLFIVEDLVEAEETVPSLAMTTYTFTCPDNPFFCISNGYMGGTVRVTSSFGCGTRPL